MFGPFVFSIDSTCCFLYHTCNCIEVLCKLWVGKHFYIVTSYTITLTLRRLWLTFRPGTVGISAWIINFINASIDNYWFVMYFLLFKFENGCIYEASLPPAAFQDHCQLIYLQGFKLNLPSKYSYMYIGLRLTIKQWWLQFIL